VFAVGVNGAPHGWLYPGFSARTLRFCVASPEKRYRPSLSVVTFGGHDWYSTEMSRPTPVSGRIPSGVLSYTTPETVWLVVRLAHLEHKTGDGDLGDVRVSAHPVVSNMRPMEGASLPIFRGDHSVPALSGVARKGNIATRCDTPGARRVTVVFGMLSTTPLCASCTCLIVAVAGDCTRALRIVQHSRGESPRKAPRAY
jgi:hypothetical protein